MCSASLYLQPYNNHQLLFQKLCLWNVGCFTIILNKKDSQWLCIFADDSCFRMSVQQQNCHLPFFLPHTCLFPFYSFYKTIYYYYLHKKICSLISTGGTIGAELATCTLAKDVSFHFLVSRNDLLLFLNLKSQIFYANTDCFDIWIDAVLKQICVPRKEYFMINSVHSTTHYHSVPHSFVNILFSSLVVRMNRLRFCLCECNWGWFPFIAWLLLVQCFTVGILIHIYILTILCLTSCLASAQHLLSLTLVQKCFFYYNP